MNVNEIFETYSQDVITNLQKDNIKKIAKLLLEEKCNYCQELLENYLDLFTIDYEEFKTKYNKLNIKYNNQFLNYASKDMNLFEEFYN